MPCNSPWYGASLVVALLVPGLLQPCWSAADQKEPAARPQGAAGKVSPSERSLGVQGARLATQGRADNGIPACASCHGAQGEGMAASGVPRLAGQLPAYLVRQIESFSLATRTHPVMSPLAKAMTLEQNIAAAFYYATLEPGTAASNASAQPGPVLVSPAPATSASASQSVAPDRGQTLASAGDEAAKIQACADCHGAGGKGGPPAYPYLAGQHASYLMRSLAQWKSGQRKNDSSGQMQAIAARLSDADIAALATYYASQPPPGGHR